VVERARKADAALLRLERAPKGRYRLWWNLAVARRRHEAPLRPGQVRDIESGSRSLRVEVLTQGGVRTEKRGRRSERWRAHLVRVLQRSEVA
jgi:hypothetical protein